MSTPRFQDVLNQIVFATVNALNAAGVTTPAQVGIGKSVSTELVKILNSQQYQITLIQRQGTTRSTARYPSQDLFQIGNPVSTLSVEVITPTGLGLGTSGSGDESSGLDGSGNPNVWTLSFAGSAGAGAFVAVVVGALPEAATYQAAVNESLATTVAGVAEAINALGLQNVVATVFGTSVLVAGSPMCTANVNGTGYVLAREVNRLTRSVQMSIACANPTLRFQVADAIESAVGTVDAPFLTLSDGTQAFCVHVGGAGTGSDDDSQSSYSLYLEHLLFEIEYGVLKTYPTYPIDVVEATITTPSGATATVVSGGTA